MNETEIKKCLKNGQAVNWIDISMNTSLSEPFIETYRDWLDARNISEFQRLSEPFIEKHKGWLNAWCISECQQLSEPFIEKHKKWLDVWCISAFQQLSEPFIETHKKWLTAWCISRFQHLSEPFIKKHRDWLNARNISRFQQLSEEFIEKHKGWLDARNISEYQPAYFSAPIKSKHVTIEEYAAKNKLEIKDGYLYAYRDHDKTGAGLFNKTIKYTKKNHLYKDWHCDLNPLHEDSYGLGIFPTGNTLVRVPLDCWGTAEYNDTNRNKARVWGFEIV